MRIKMRAWLAGETPDGDPWPSTGGVIDIDDDVANGLVSSGLAIEIAPDPVTPDPVPETVAAEKPVKKARKPRATTKEMPDGNSV